MNTHSKTLLKSEVAAVTLLVGGMARTDAAAAASPVGTWDFYLTGAHGQKGIAFFKFADDGTNRTFEGFQHLMGNANSGSVSTVGRNDGVEQGRNDLSTSGSSGSSNEITTLFGFGDVSG